MSYLRLCFGRGCGHSEPASYEFRCAAWPSTPELRYCGQLLVPWYRRHGGVLDKADKTGVGAAARNSRSAKNRRMRGCTG